MILTMKNKQGGRREGSGRPMLEDEPQSRRNITLCQRLIDKARRIGEGNISEGIRRALEKHNGRIYKTKGKTGD